MTAVELLARLRTLDVHVRVDGSRLRVSAPKGRLTPELEAALTGRKEELLALLQPEAGHTGTRPVTPVARGGLIPSPWLRLDSARTPVRRDRVLIPAMPPVGSA